MFKTRNSLYAGLALLVIGCALNAVVLLPAQRVGAWRNWSVAVIVGQLCWAASFLIGMRQSCVYADRLDATGSLAAERRLAVFNAAKWSLVVGSLLLDALLLERAYETFFILPR